MTREEILKNNLLTDFLSYRGIKGRTTNLCPNAQHKRGHNCVSIDQNRQIWHCNDCSVGGSIVDWISKESGKDVKTVLQELGGVQESFKPPNGSKMPETKENKIAAIYGYTDEAGKLLFEVVRYEPKGFKQRLADGTWGLGNIQRVIYNLPKVLKASTVAITEGEKDCHTIEKETGLVATTNAGGSGSWMAGYGEYFKGKNVIIFPDNDDPGKKWTDSVIASLIGKAQSVKVVRVPSGFKDVTEYVESKQSLLLYVSKNAQSVVDALPLYSMVEMEERYRSFVKRMDECSLDLSACLPSLKIRRLVPGELVLIMADTGVGKSLFCQAIARAATPMPTLFFELELPLELMYERFLQMETGCYGHEVEADYRDNNESYIDGFKGLHHILVCPESGLSVDQIESYIVRSELKFGKPPVLVCVDYVGLIRNKSTRGRYEAVSESAEALKVIAKRTNTIVVMSSQVARPDNKKSGLEIRLHDAKDSGSLENSAGLILGMWRPEPKKMMIKVLKNTKGQSGLTIECNFDGAKMKITENVI